jgi:hypothetical protein
MVGDEQLAGDTECCGARVFRMPSVLWRPRYEHDAGVYELEGN